MAVGEFTGDSEQGEKGNNSSPNTPRPEAEASQTLTTAAHCSLTDLLKTDQQNHCEGRDSVSDRAWTAG